MLYKVLSKVLFFLLHLFKTVSAKVRSSVEYMPNVLDRGGKKKKTAQKLPEEKPFLCNT